jgi:hypothetical protein
MRELFNSVPIKRTRRQKSMDKINSADVKPLSEQGGIVTPQQWKFIKELCDEDGKITLRQAAINAGYPKDKAHQTANNLTSVKQYPQVVRAIQDYRYEQAEKYGTNYERHMRDLQVIRDKALAAGNFGAAVSAEFRRGQALGSIYIDKKITLTGSIDSMSKEEVRRKLDEIKRLHGAAASPEILDITPEQIEEIKDEPETNMLEAMRNGERARSITTQATEAEFTEITDSPVGEPGKSGDTGLPDSSAAEPVHPDGAESSEEREESPPVASPDGLCDEAQLTKNASVHIGGVASEGHVKAD